MHDAPAMATLYQVPLDPRPPTPPTSPPPLDEDEEEEDFVDNSTPCSTSSDSHQLKFVYNGEVVLKRQIGEATRQSLRDIHFIDSSSTSGSDVDDEDYEGVYEVTAAAARAGELVAWRCDANGRRECTEKAVAFKGGMDDVATTTGGVGDGCGGGTGTGTGGIQEEEEEDVVVLIHDEEEGEVVCAGEKSKGRRRRGRRSTNGVQGGVGAAAPPRGTSTSTRANTTSSATVGGGEHTAALGRSCRCHEGGGTTAVVTAAATATNNIGLDPTKPPPSTCSCSPSSVPGSSSASPPTPPTPTSIPFSTLECIMKHKCGSATTSDLGDHTTAPPHAPSSMAAADAALQQQQQPAGSGSAMVTTTSSSSNSSSISGSSGSIGSGGGGAPLRSALKKAGQKSKGHRVSINEAKNECLEADYVILVHEENEPQLVSIRSFDLSLAPGSGVEQVTLSPPEGYKDCFSHASSSVDDSGVCDLASVVTHVLRMGGDTESGSGDGLVDLDTPRPHLPDLVTHRTPSTQLTVENVRHHDQLMQGKESEGNDSKVAKTGILKGGKLWKNGDSKKTKPKVEVEEVEEPRRSVRFSGRDEYSMLENLPLDKIPLDAANSATLAKFMPKLRELGMLLGEPRDDWHVELSPINPEPEESPGIVSFDHHPPLEEEKQPPPQMDDEQISESMQRYEEMRRRIAAAEGRDNTSVCSDESKSSSDSQSSDSTMTETRIRRLENSDMAHVAGGVMRSNSEVRRAIEHNKLRRSLTRFSDARKKDTNKNERNEKGETSILEKLRWLTATEDATNGNMDQDNGDDKDGEGTEGKETKKEIDPKVQETIAQYRKLAEMFNKTTSLRTTEILVPGDVREWKLQADLFPEKKGSSIESTTEELPESHSGSTTPTVFQAIPVVSISELVSDEDCDKLIYSGGVRYTREGTLPTAGEEEDEEQDQQQPVTANTQTSSDTRKQFLTTMSGHSGVPLMNGVAGTSRDRSSLASNSDSYTFDDIDEALHDDRSSSVPSSSQSSPRLSGRSDMDGTSTTESGYSSNETNGELCPVSTAQLLELPPGGVDVDELAEFVRQDAGRMERLRRRYDAGEQEDYGFTRRPSVRGIKPRFGSTTDLLKQMATQLAPPAMAQSGMAGSHMTWPYRDAGDEDAAPQRRRAAPNRAVLPALQEDMLYIPTSDLSPQTSSAPSTSTATSTSLTHTKSPRVVHVYASTGDLRAPPPPRLQGPRESPPPDLIRPGATPNPSRPHSLASASQVPLHGSVQSLIMAPQMPTPNAHEHHHAHCRRPASVHGHLPPDNLINRGVPPPPAAVVRPHPTISHYPPPPRVPVHYHPYEEPPMPRTQFEGGHPPLAQRGSYPGTVPAPIPTPHYQPQIIPNDPARYPNPPPYGAHPHTHQPMISPREGVPYPRTSHPQVHSVPQVPSIPPGSIQVHHCGPRHPPQPRMTSGVPTEPACSSVWSHQLIPPGSAHQAFPLHPVSSHLSYTTPIVPESGIPARPTGLSVGPSVGPPVGQAIINGTIGKLEGIRDERGVPEGASSSPRGPSDPQYSSSHASPTRDPGILHRHPPPPPINMT